jgi:hypothetical protein
MMKRCYLCDAKVHLPYEYKGLTLCPSCAERWDVPVKVPEPVQKQRAETYPEWKAKQPVADPFSLEGFQRMEGARAKFIAETEQRVRAAEKAMMENVLREDLAAATYAVTNPRPVPSYRELCRETMRLFKESEGICRCEECQRLLDADAAEGMGG